VDYDVYTLYRAWGIDPIVLEESVEFSSSEKWIQELIEQATDHYSKYRTDSLVELSQRNTAWLENSKKYHRFDEPMTNKAIKDSSYV
jgi:hypothetical protein